MDRRSSPVEARVGYALKRAQAALRATMDETLRPLGLTVAQYSCLQLIGERPGISSAELARGMFVSRQSMNLVLRGLQERGLVERPSTAPQARSLPARLTPAGRRLAKRADELVAGIEAQMVATLPPAQQSQLLAGLTACAEALGRQTDDDDAR
ncbi:MAG TPA: MarR family transcriptional regulator [Solirubrobacterales bacterium]|nr:MarR family transcriptional regulator [Solirubrobacterales bacterium]